MGDVGVTLRRLCPICGDMAGPRSGAKTCGRAVCVSAQITRMKTGAPRRDRPLEERFWVKVGERGPGECWEWHGNRTPRLGYGRIGKGHDVYLAHRVSWELHFGPIPAGLHVLHRCDNPPCVNPAHLFLGDQAVNSNDMWAKGRGSGPPHRLGEAVNTAKLTEEIVRECRRRAAMGESPVALAREFGVVKSTMQRAVSRRNWAHV